MVRSIAKIGSQELGELFMLRMTFTESEVKVLHYQRFHHPHPRSQQKMEALLLKAKGLPHHQIAAYLDICENTLRQYFKQYQAGGVAALKQLNYHLPSSDLVLLAATLEYKWKKRSK